MVDAVFKNLSKLRGLNSGWESLGKMAYLARVLEFHDNVQITCR